MYFAAEKRILESIIFLQEIQEKRKRGSGTLFRRPRLRLVQLKVFAEIFMKIFETSGQQYPEVAKMVLENPIFSCLEIIILYRYVQICHS